MSDDLIELAFEATPKLIKVIGVGGGGGNAVGQMYRDQIPDVRYLVVNTDQKALADSVVPDRLQLGPGLGAGGVPERGRKLAEENVQKIREALDEETHMVFITELNRQGRFWMRKSAGRSMPTPTWSSSRRAWAAERVRVLRPSSPEKPARRESSQ